MREPERIDRITLLLNEIWTLVPDWRLTQLVVNASDLGESYPKLFHLEDSEIEKKLEELLIKIQESQTE